VEGRTNSFMLRDRWRSNLCLRDRELGWLLGDGGSPEGGFGNNDDVKPGIDGVSRRPSGRMTGLWSKGSKGGFHDQEDAELIAIKGPLMSHDITLGGLSAGRGLAALRTYFMFLVTIN
jgi:hypothetical protein